MRDPIQFGRHTLHFEEPGIAVIVYHGPVSIEEMRILCAVPDQEQHGGRFQLTLCDVRDLGWMDGAVRKMASERPRPAAKYYAAYVGVNHAMRVIISMWTRATNLLQAPKNEVAFFDDHESAKAWLREVWRGYQR